MIFAVIVFILTFPFRKAGWFISKKFIYVVSIPLALIVSFLWGALLAYFVHILIRWQNPALIVKIIFGYGFGSYLAIPNFKLFDESTLPDEELKRTAFIYVVSILGFIMFSVILGFMM